LLKEMILRELAGRRTRRLRVWSAACGAGEEPYTIAMLLLECLGEDIGQWDVAILATDIDPKALDRAREGVFTAQDMAGKRPTWLARYFVPKEGNFRVQPALTQLVTFEAHNLVNDPPFRDLDLVVCRNVLIYFTPALQTRVLKGFHGALSESGFLLLGEADVPMGETKGLFDCLHAGAKLYQKVG